jgi:chemotaxis protein MotB
MSSSPVSSEPVSETSPPPPAQDQGQKKKRSLLFSARPPGQPGAIGEEWLLSYADMVTLLLTVFIALLLNANFEKPGTGAEPGGPRRIFENLLQLRAASPYQEGEAFVAAGTPDWATASAAAEGGTLAILKEEDLERIRRREVTLGEIRARLKSSQLDDFVSADIEGGGIRLKIPNSILFDSGAAELQGRGPNVIRALAPILAVGQYGVSVEGHTDNIPIKTSRFPSNWELSAQRAAAVVRTLAESGVGPQRLEAVGYGESRPLVDNVTEEGRRENRRVTLILRIP